MPLARCFVGAAAVEATAEGTLEPLVEVALSAPDMRGTLGWPADLPLLVGHIGGSLRREVELDAPLRVSHEAGGALVVTEIKLSAAGEGEMARSQPNRLSLIDAAQTVGLQQPGVPPGGRRAAVRAAGACAAGAAAAPT